LHQVQSDTELYAVQPDGSGLVQLTHNLVEDDEPAWSPDGKRIALVRTGPTSYPIPRVRGIYVLDTTTHREHVLVALQGFVAGVWPAWSPDGSQLAYVRNHELAIARADGTLVRLIRTHGDARRPTWSPDGTQLAFADSANRELLAVHADGTGLHAVVPVDSADAPAWSPDGKWIAFAGRPTQASRTGIWLVHPDGTGFRLVAAGANASLPAWSPDSTQLVYEDGTTLHVAAADGSSDRALQLPVTQPFSPSWGR
jgi:TolB protein